MLWAPDYGHLLVVDIYGPMFYSYSSNITESIGGMIIYLGHIMQLSKQRTLAIPIITFEEESSLISLPSFPILLLYMYL